MFRRPKKFQDQRGEETAEKYLLEFLALLDDLKKVKPDLSDSILSGISLTIIAKNSAKAAGKVEDTDILDVAYNALSNINGTDLPQAKSICDFIYQPADDGINMEKTAGTNSVEAYCMASLLVVINGLNDFFSALKKKIDTVEAMGEDNYSKVKFLCDLKCEVNRKWNLAFRPSKHDENYNGAVRSINAKLSEVLDNYLLTLSDKKVFSLDKQETGLLLMVYDRLQGGEDLRMQAVTFKRMLTRHIVEIFKSKKMDAILDLMELELRFPGDQLAIFINDYIIDFSACYEHTIQMTRRTIYSPAQQSQAKDEGSYGEMIALKIGFIKQSYCSDTGEGPLLDTIAEAIYANKDYDLSPIESDSVHVSSTASPGSVGSVDSEDGSPVEAVITNDEKREVLIRNIRALMGVYFTIYKRLKREGAHKDRHSADIILEIITLRRYQARLMRQQPDQPLVTPYTKRELESLRNTPQDGSATCTMPEGAPVARKFQRPTDLGVSPWIRQRNGDEPAGTVVSPHDEGADEERDELAPLVFDAALLLDSRGSSTSPGDSDEDFLFPRCSTFVSAVEISTINTMSKSVYHDKNAGLLFTSLPRKETVVDVEASDAVSEIRGSRPRSKSRL